MSETESFYSAISSQISRSHLLKSPSLASSFKEKDSLYNESDDESDSYSDSSTEMKIQNKDKSILNSLERLQRENEEQLMAKEMMATKYHGEIPSLLPDLNSGKTINSFSNSSVSRDKIPFGLKHNQLKPQITVQGTFFALSEQLKENKKENNALQGVNEALLLRIKQAENTLNEKDEQINHVQEQFLASEEKCRKLEQELEQQRMNYEGQLQVERQISEKLRDSLKEADDAIKQREKNIAERENEIDELRTSIKKIQDAFSEEKMKNEMLTETEMQGAIEGWKMEVERERERRKQEVIQFEQQLHEKEREIQQITEREQEARKMFEQQLKEIQEAKLKDEEEKIRKEKELEERHGGLSAIEELEDSLSLSPASPIRNDARNEIDVLKNQLNFLQTELDKKVEELTKTCKENVNLQNELQKIRDANQNECKTDSGSDKQINASSMSQLSSTKMMESSAASTTSVAMVRALLRVWHRTLDALSQIKITPKDLIVLDKGTTAAVTQLLYSSSAPQMQTDSEVSQSNKATECVTRRTPENLSEWLETKDTAEPTEERIGKALEALVKLHQWRINEKETEISKIRLNSHMATKRSLQLMEDRCAVERQGLQMEIAVLKQQLSSKSISSENLMKEFQEEEEEEEETATTENHDKNVQLDPTTSPSKEEMIKHLKKVEAAPESLQLIELKFDRERLQGEVDSLVERIAKMQQEYEQILHQSMRKAEREKSTILIEKATQEDRVYIRQLEKESIERITKMKNEYEEIMKEKEERLNEVEKCYEQKTNDAIHKYKQKSEELIYKFKREAAKYKTLLHQSNIKHSLNQSMFSEDMRAAFIRANEFMVEREQSIHLEHERYRNSVIEELSKQIREESSKQLEKEVYQVTERLKKLHKDSLQKERFEISTHYRQQFEQRLKEMHALQEYEAMEKEKEEQKRKIKHAEVKAAKQAEKEELLLSSIHSELKRSLSMVNPLSDIQDKREIDSLQSKTHKSRSISPKGENVKFDNSNITEKSKRHSSKISKDKKRATSSSLKHSSSNRKKLS
ncbi:putative Exocyst complex component Sec5 [Monocercomonoides exilis]|uniref:putative Exocyst complex component Sec5 n=1 Tax=Monocercomonoides exilis TaxID=2049356 RepID=UPI003559C7F7|nr:putative Exocyst complex component Sec5 [Monocercomonoides exilis]|eukprot:MONOS_7405.1-p1 / transcript=MONOS_7405.1 / gene=MONOS_7405 / organism=Monocercomonoides_exilis_PA203 / gene_product= Exocyst complex component Sec5 / transcript_product= Exocyst complex component Sec5 / location=Mono_scaffold00252:21703-25599(+) / protein_length=1037 / sequence_SO=supercontig / SO=protein_coding / is_pseudo=false